MTTNTPEELAAEIKRLALPFHYDENRRPIERALYVPEQRLCDLVAHLASLAAAAQVEAEVATPHSPVAARRVVREAMAAEARMAVQSFMDLVANNEDYEIAEYQRLSRLASERVVFAINNLRDDAAAPAPEARKPLEPDTLADKAEAWLQAGGASNVVDAYEAGYRAAEQANGITTPEVQP